MTEQEEHETRAAASADGRPVRAAAAPQVGADRAVAEHRRPRAGLRHRHHDLPVLPDAGRGVAGRDSASVWENQIAREATIQIKPADGLDMDAALDTAAPHRRRLRRRARGPRSSTAKRPRGCSSRGSAPGSNIDELPVPRLVIITIDEDNPPDFAQMRAMLTPEVPTATLDDHRTWVDRLVSMARTTVTIGMAVLVLMLSATVLSVVFATRGAMAGNGHIIEVLHFVGAEATLHRRRIPPAFPGHRHEGRARPAAPRRSSSSSSFPGGRR